MNDKQPSVSKTKPPHSDCPCVACDNWRSAQIKPGMHVKGASRGPNAGTHCWRPDEPCLWGWTLQSKCSNGTAIVIVIGPSNKVWRGHREHAVAILLNKGSSHERVMLTLSQWLEPA